MDVNFRTLDLNLLRVFDEVMAERNLTRAEVRRLFAALSRGGKIEMPIGETSWSQRFGMFVDLYGVHWMVNCNRPQ